MGILTRSKKDTRYRPTEVGSKFGRLTTIGVDFFVRVDGREFRQSCVVVQCECGEVTCVPTNSLRTGNTTSCGCYHRDRCREAMKVNPPTASHRMTGTRIYRLWKYMVKRCENPNFEHFRNYGGRGISVCKEWRENPQAFISWAFANGYKDSLTIDRKDRDGNYEPGNCQWLTRSENTKKSFRDYPAAQRRRDREMRSAS